MSDAAALRSVLVTGGAGFLGRALAAHLVERGVAVRSLDLHPCPAPGVESRVADLRDAEAVARACEGVDTVFHTAAMIDWSLNKRAQLHAVNVDGTAHVIAGCRAHQVPRLVYTSTVDVVFSGQPIVGGDERTPYPARHLDDYAHSKAIAERLVLASHGEDLAACALRVATLWGPGERFRVRRFAEMAKNRQLAALGDGRSRFSHLYVTNAVTAHRLAAERLGRVDALGGRALFLVDEPADNFFGFYTPILQRAGLEASWRWIPAGPLYPLAVLTEWANRLGLTGQSPPLLTRFTLTSTSRDFWFVGARSREVLGDYRVVPLEEAIEATAGWVRAQVLAGSA